VNKKIPVTGGVLLGIIFIWVMIAQSQKGPAVETRNPPSKAAAKELYQKAVKLSKDHDLLKSKESFQRLIAEYPDYDLIDSAQKELERINLEIITSNVQTPQSVTHEVQPGDTLGKIANKYGTTVELVKMSNNLKSDVIRPGQKLRLWTGKFNIFVDKSQNILILKGGSEIIKVYTVSTGENNSTPAGTYKITSKLTDPVWFHSGAIVPPESPQNVLGSRWLGFDLAGYGIHGTVEPDSIGKQVTAGCVRMRNQEVEELFNLVTLGTEVVIVD